MFLKKCEECGTYAELRAGIDHDTRARTEVCVDCLWVLDPFLPAIVVTTNNEEK